MLNRLLVISNTVSTVSALQDGRIAAMVETGLVFAAVLVMLVVHVEQKAAKRLFIKPALWR